MSVRRNVPQFVGIDIVGERVRPRPSRGRLRESSGTRQTSMFSATLANAMRPDAEIEGLRSLAVPKVSRWGVPATSPVANATGTIQTFELAL